MSVIDRMILDEFKIERDNFVKLEEEVDKVLRDLLNDKDFLLGGIEHRVKTEKSLEIKLNKKSGKYKSMDDITDLLGVRIICCFVDDVNKIGKLIEEKFDIDWENSVDKRKNMDTYSFGYLSLHYIASLKKEEGYPEELTSKRFEIQIRSILQHAWAVAEHDTFYKTEFGTPKELVRGFARLAGLLELADAEFVRTRDRMKEYTEEIRKKITDDNAEGIDIDIVSLREYMLRNKKMREFLLELAKIEKSEITESNPDNYIIQLKWLKIDTIGKLQAVLEKDKEIIFKLAKNVLEGSELDIMTSNVALRFLCQAELLLGNYTEEQIVEFITLTVKDEERARRQAKRLYLLKEEL